MFENKCIVIIDFLSLEINSFLVFLFLKNIKDVVYCCRIIIEENVVIFFELEIVLVGKMIDKLLLDSYVVMVEIYIDKIGVFVVKFLILSDCI